MEFLKSFIIDNFILFCVSIVVLVNAFQNKKTQRNTSIYFILIIALAISLAIVSTLELHAKASLVIPYATIVSAFGYYLRPICIYLFILMSVPKKSKKWMILSSIPLMLNFVIISLAFFPGVKEYVYSYSVDENGMHFHGSYLRFITHLVSLFYLVWLVYASTAKLKSKHLYHGIAIISCASFVIVAVVLESFFNDNGDIYLLNATIGVGAISYYLYLYKEETQSDALTGLFNRDTYYRDLPRMEKTITGIIQFDLNGLKYLNDNFGHLEGDLALSTIAGIIQKCAKKNMYVYRLGGDEFIVIANNCPREDIVETVERIQDEINKTKYHCSIGFAYRENKNISVDDIIKQAEKEMYLDKDKFYRQSHIERRKTGRD